MEFKTKESLLSKLSKTKIYEWLYGITNTTIEVTLGNGEKKFEFRPDKEYLEHLQERNKEVIQTLKETAQAITWILGSVYVLTQIIKELHGVYIYWIH